uniref:Uncharacterized protein n=1 Tax=Chromera velia CCMP2878 TaxID=1169474 RepID=A0A0G4GDW7_9ALVE|eukprot:Cvel_21433.t1-p1 / transcript=Cvel_21433.t1 / gene=Cvel_21433 / organism=Chromera_velia_CCMP2878 / gene_product=hypothetical protein / transcript_product=hypothetical protein / location=Cvel_scaffold2009:28781-29849(-) / protein_length=235 / sequence_SO=supercontig / SO=protein_coding / is_pseudo=false
MDIETDAQKQKQSEKEEDADKEVSLPLDQTLRLKLTPVLAVSFGVPSAGTRHLPFFFGSSMTPCSIHGARLFFAFASLDEHLTCHQISISHLFKDFLLSVRRLRHPDGQRAIYDSCVEWINRKRAGSDELVSVVDALPSGYEGGGELQEYLCRQRFLEGRVGEAPFLAALCAALSDRVSPPGTSPGTAPWYVLVVGYDERDNMFILKEAGGMVKLDTHTMVTNATKTFSLFLLEH